MAQAILGLDKKTLIVILVVLCIFLVYLVKGRTRRIKEAFSDADHSLPFSYNKIHTGKECLPNGPNDEVYLGTYDTVRECAEACKAEKKNDCKWFIYGTGEKTGTCWWEKKCDKTNLEDDSYDVYEISSGNERCMDVPSGWWRPQTPDELKMLVPKSGKRPTEIPCLNKSVDVSSITSMCNLFRDATNFNQDISDWDVSGVTNFDYMFYNSGLDNDPEKTNLKKIYCSWKNKINTTTKKYKPASHTPYTCENHEAPDVWDHKVGWLSGGGRTPKESFEQEMGFRMKGQRGVRDWSEILCRKSKAISYNKIYSGKECLSNEPKDEVNLGTYDTVHECAAACNKSAKDAKEKCRWFIYGHGEKTGACWWEKKCDKTNLEKDSYDVYEMSV